MAAWNAATTERQRRNGSGAKGSAAVTKSNADLAIEQPEHTYRRLQQSGHKSPQDYFVLAAISDLLPEREPHGFLKWLIAGIKQHPQDPGIQQLLREHLRTDIKLAFAPSALLAVAKATADDVFFRLTEPLWDRLLHDGGFARFAQTLTQCERHVKQVDEPSRTAFYLHMLRPCLWKADPQWIDRVIGRIERHGAALRPDVESDFEFIRLVREYQQNDRGRLDASPVRKQLDQMIRSYCDGGESQAAASVSEVLHEIARDSHGVIAAFPTEQSEDDFRLVSICMMIAGDVAQQTAVEFSDATERQSERQAGSAVNDLRESLDTVGRRIVWMRRRIFCLPFLLLVAVPPLLLAGLVASNWLFMIWGGWIAISLSLYLLLIKPRFLDGRAKEKTRHVLLQAYEVRWRARIYRYVQSCGMAPQLALARLDQTAREHGDADWMSVVFSLVRHDPGLLIFGQAQAFVS